MVLAYVEYLDAPASSSLEAATEFLGDRRAAGAEVAADAALRRGGGPRPGACGGGRRLLARMLVYHRYRQAAEHLRDRLEAEHGYRYRSAPLPPELRRIWIETADAEYDPVRLAEALGGLLTVPPPLDLRHVRRPAVSVEQRLRHLRDLSSRSRFSFDDAVVGADDRGRHAVRAARALQGGRGQVEQEVPFGPITVVSS